VHHITTPPPIYLELIKQLQYTTLSHLSILKPTMSSGLSKLATALVCISISASSSKTTTTAFMPPASSINNNNNNVHSTAPTTSLPMSFTDVSNFYADFPLQAAVLTCGVKASVADGIAQARPIAIKQKQQKKQNNYINDQENPTFIDFSTLSTNSSSWIDDLEFRRNIAYIIYGGIFIGAL